MEREFDKRKGDVVNPDLDSNRKRGQPRYALAFFQTGCALADLMFFFEKI